MAREDQIAQRLVTPFLDGERLDIKEFWAESMGWVSAFYAELLIALVLALTLFTAFSFLKNRLQNIADQQNNSSGLGTLLLRVFSRTGMFFLIMLSIVMVAGFARAPARLGQLIDLLFFVALVVQIAIWLRALTLGLIDRKITRSEKGGGDLQNARNLIRLMVTIALAVIAAIIILDNIGVNVTALVAGLGVGGIAIGLAAQGIFSDLFAALSIIFDKPFQKGESIMFDGFDGTVEATGLKTTRLRSITGEEVVISNTNLLDKKIRNMSRLTKRRIRFPIGVVYQTSAEQAAAIPAIFQDIVEQHGFRFIRCGFTGFGASSLDFRMEFEILSGSWEDVFAGRSAVGLALVERFAAEGIEFAYPTQVNFTAAADGSMISPAAGKAS